MSKQSLLSRLALGSALSLGALALPGCMAPGSGAYPKLSNGWVDADHNGTISPDEYVNPNKTVFRPAEIIMVSTDIDNRTGETVEMLMFGADNRLVASRSTVINYPQCVPHFEFKVGDLMRNGGAGDYTVNWRINGTNIDAYKFTIIP